MSVTQDAGEDYSAHSHLRSHFVARSHNDHTTMYAFDVNAVAATDIDDDSDVNLPTGITLTKINDEEGADVALNGHILAVNVTSGLTSGTTLTLPFNESVDLATVDANEPLPPVAYYNLTVTSNPEHFTYTVEPEATENGYQAGTDITVKFTKTFPEVYYTTFTHNNGTVNLTTAPADASHHYEYTINGIDQDTDLVLSSDTPVAIDEVNAEGTGNDEVYDLMGRRLAAPVKGAINIVNGRKVLVF